MAMTRVRWWPTAGLLLALAAGVGLYQRIGPVAPAPVTTAPVDPVALALAAGKPAVIEFGANACVSCREMKPVLTALAQSYGDRITVLDVDILKERHLIGQYQIRLMPTQVFFDAQGRETGRNMGKISAEDILARLGVPHTP